MSAEIVPGSGEPAAPVVDTSTAVVVPPATIIDSAPAQPAPIADWRVEHLPVAMRDNPTLSKFGNVEALANEHINVQKVIGADKIPRPQDDWTPEQYDDFYTKLGRPANVDDYDLEGVAEVPEGVPFDGEFQSAAVAKMHELGLNSAQVKGLLNFNNEYVGGKHEASAGEIERSVQAGITDLRNEWGKSYDAQVDMATRALNAAAGDSADQIRGIQLADGSLLGDNPAIVRAFAAIGGKMSEHGLPGAMPSRSILSPGESLAEIAKLEAEGAHILSDKNHPEHAIMIEKRNALYTSAYPEE